MFSFCKCRSVVNNSFKNPSLTRILTKNPQCSRFKHTYRQERHKTASTTIGPFGLLLLTVPVSTFALGTWQIQRKKWKENLIRDMKERVNANPVLLPNTMEDIEKLEYYPVHVRGRFLHNREIHMGPRTLLEKGDASTQSSLISKNEKTQGYLIITPFKLEDRDEIILVNRGWVPPSKRNPEKRKEGQIEGVTDVIGVVRLQETRPNFMPANRMDANSWFYRDLEQMSAATGAQPIFIDATEDFNTPNSPVGGQTRISLRNEHLSYVFTWFSLCGITSYMWCKKFIIAK